MAEEKKQENTNNKDNKEKQEAVATENKKTDSKKNVGQSVYAKKKKFDKRKKRARADRAKDEFEQRIVDLARVTRVMAGGKRMRFRACVALGDKKGKVGFGLAKGADVTIAITKAVNKAKKNMINVPIVNQTIPHEIYKKVGAAKILLKPARKGKGVIAGGAARTILELAGIHNITSKILGTNNKVNIVRSVIEALDSLKKVEPKKPKNNKKSNSTEKKEKSKAEDKTSKK